MFASEGSQEDIRINKIKKKNINKNMPKKNKKGRGHDHDSNSDDESLNDNGSLYSHQSENIDIVEEVDDISVNERYEDKFSTALENATEKSAQTRAQALQSLCEIMMHRFMPDYVENRKITLLDCIEKSIRRGKGAEQVWGAKLAPLLILQLGGDQGISKTLNQFLLITMQDKSVAFGARSKCCAALGLLNFLGCVDIGDILSLMQSFEGIFSGSYLKGDDKTPILTSVDAGSLHAEALIAWGLLITLIPSGDFVSIFNSGQQNIPSIKKLMGLLQSPNLEVRMAAGETIVLILESGRAHDDAFMEDDLTNLIDIVKKLATDSHKYRAKRDRKAQRATFRDLLRYLEEDISPEVTIRFGTESMVLNTWAIHHQYTALCSTMGPGMTSHLKENEFIRDIFDLGGRVLPTSNCKQNKQSKLERHLINAAAFKVRSITRGKNRDKRSAVIN